MLVLVPALLFAQTPLEFGIVDDLIRGEPYISPLSIKVMPGAPVPGETTLLLAVRAGVVFSDEGAYYYMDSLPDQVNLMGRLDFRGLITDGQIRRIFTVVRNNMRAHGAMGITRLEIDLVTPDDMGWLAFNAPLARVDSLLSGELSSFGFWDGAEVRRLQVGMSDFRFNDGFFDPTQVPDIPETVVITEPSRTAGHAWKSLILPGWGQFSSGAGLPLVNLLAEAGGIALLFTDDYVNVGAGVLAVNHLVSFTDLL
jgi:hypothetical protein